MRRMLLVAMIALIGLGIGLVVWDPTGLYSEFCTADGLLVEPPMGWELSRDHHNDCVWTLFNENRGRAPAELYARLPIEPPPDYPNDWDALGWTMMVGSVVAVTMSLRSRLP